MTIAGTRLVSSKRQRSVHRPIRASHSWGCGGRGETPQAPKTKRRAHEAQNAQKSADDAECRQHDPRSGGRRWGDLRSAVTPGRTSTGLVLGECHGLGDRGRVHGGKLRHEYGVDDRPAERADACEHVLANRIRWCRERHVRLSTTRGRGSGGQPTRQRRLKRDHRAQHPPVHVISEFGRSVGKRLAVPEHCQESSLRLQTQIRCRLAGTTRPTGRRTWTQRH